MEGKETRIGRRLPRRSSPPSHGGFLRRHECHARLLHAAGGRVPMWLIDLRGLCSAASGRGLYGMLGFAIMAVFVAGLMIAARPNTSARKSNR